MNQATAFRFGTKADNLEQLQHLVTASFIPAPFIIRVGEWYENASKVTKEISERFPGQQIVIRSSAPNEDSFEFSMAGAYESVLHIDSGNSFDVEQGMAHVISSYTAKGSRLVDDYQLIVQPMVNQVRMGGVIFTRDLENNGPYYLLNYDDRSGRTDTVTSGHHAELQTVYIQKNIDLKDLTEPLNNLILAVRELERITRADRLDIEFAIDANGFVFILQVRPLVLKKIMNKEKLDRNIATTLQGVKSYYKESVNNSRVFGTKPIYGQMPDWNPAEIIGAHPRSLSVSLYNQLIMRRAWHKGRALLGYNEPSTENLMVTMAGRPYVDVRNSFNSLLPIGLTPSLCDKLIDFYIDKLERTPSLHDKVEFEIVISCMTFNFEQQSTELLANGFSETEIHLLKANLLELTNKIVLNDNGMLSSLEERLHVMKNKREMLMSRSFRVEQIPFIIQSLIEDCTQYGTIPFSAVARCAFIGKALLKSMVSDRLITEEQYHRFLASIETVATLMVDDLDKWYGGKMDIDEFLAAYGHLRPGTYDIACYSYREKPDYYFTRPANPTQQLVSEYFKEDIQAAFPHDSITERLTQEGFAFNSSTLLRFIREFIQKRESVKFEFTKNIDLILHLLVQFGDYFGLSRDDLSYLDISDITQYANTTLPPFLSGKLKSIVEFNRETHAMEKFIYMPDLITGESDLEIIKYAQRIPNYITQKNISAEIVCLDRDDYSLDAANLTGKIVMIEKADPGYDWLFAYPIAGLITKYGGAASHMSIRCAEFSMPAAIGCGEKLYSLLKAAESVNLNCKAKSVEPVGVRV
ncbi:PEP/pyruvate-binding domain-containing protein [Cohnella yongneupensis]|uniref:PEP/pyruvate-binding domain-containing protein n=1 Tax=Cohnella yongneupensis TaxID=425006 RepID=A0ABW0QWP2_9BACL